MGRQYGDRGRARREVLDAIPDVRDGLTRIERVILWELSRCQAEKRGRNVPTAMLYGRVVEHVDITPDEMQRVLARLIGGSGRADERESSDDGEPIYQPSKTSR